MTRLWSASFIPKLFRVNCSALPGIICPFLISFFCISLFLFLSYIIIEGYSVSQMMRADRDVAEFKILDSK